MAWGVRLRPDGPIMVAGNQKGFKMGSVSARLNAQDWLRDWPLEAVEDFDKSPKTLPPEMGYPRMQQVCQAAFRQPHAVATVQEVNGLIDRLEQWNQRHASALTWPPSVDGFIKAITRDIEAGHDDAVLMRILVPDMVALAMAPVNQIADTPPLAVDSIDKEAAPAAQPKSIDPVVPKAPSKQTRPATETPRRQAASPDLALKLLDIVKSNPAGIASEKIDAAIKAHVARDSTSDPSRTSSARFKFFVKDLMPSIAMLPPTDIDGLMQCWPANAAVEIGRPDLLLARTDFWVAMKAGGPESRVAMMAKVLPRVFSGQGWSPEQSLGALEQMMARVRSPEEFSRRLGLWHAWGGNLDAPILKDAADSNDGFSTPSAGPITARSWVEEHMPAHKDQLPAARRSPKGP